jgi:oligopeptide transport system substrate-binding protein
MKKFISGTIVLIMLISLMAGCGSTQNPPASLAPEISPDLEAPDSSQYLNTLLSAEPTIIDAVFFSNLVERTILCEITEPLTKIEDGVLVPAGAESWEISDDGLVYTFHLRENYWNDGQKVTAADYAYTIEQEADPANAFVFASDIYCIKNFEARFNGDADAGELGVEAVDELTLRLTLDYPSPSLLTTFDFFPQRADYVEKYGDTFGTEADTLASCGPFVLSSWKHNSQLTLVKNDQYWDSANVLLQTVNYLIIPDSSARLSSLENGSLDYMNEVTDPDYIEKFEKNSALAGTFVESGRTYMFIFNCEDTVFKNKKIRQAFSLAVNRESIAQDLFDGLAAPAYGLIPSLSSVGNLNYREEVPEPLLALKAQYPDPKTLLIEGMEEEGLGSDPSALTVSLILGGTSETFKSQGEFYQQMFQTALGVTVQLELYDRAAHSDLVRTGKFQISASGWGANIEPQFQMTRWVGEDQAHWTNDEFESLVMGATTSLDENERLSLYAQAEDILMTDAPIAPTYYQAYIRFSYNYLRGLPSNAFDTLGVKNIYTAGRK